MSVELRVMSSGLQVGSINEATYHRGIAAPITRNFKLVPHNLQPVTFLFVIFLLTSCSIQKQIDRSAKENVLNTKALQAAHVGLSIFDPSTNKYLYNYQGDKYFVPASNTKIPTCYAAMKYLGDSLEGLRYEILSDTIITIVPTGDPTFLHPDYTVQPIFSFLKNFREIIYGGGHVEQLGSGWAWNDYLENYMAPRSVFPIYGNVINVKWINKDSLFIMPKYFPQKDLWETGYSSGFNVRRSFDENDFDFYEGNSKQRSIPFVPDRRTIIFLLEDTLRPMKAIPRIRITVNSLCI